MLGVAVVAAATVQAQQAGSARAALEQQIDRIFNAREYDAPRFGPARWLPDGTAYAIVERSKGSAEGSEIVRYDAATGSRSVLVPAARLPLDVEDYAWSSDGKRLLIFTNTERVWRQNTRGDYWVLNVQDGALKKLGGGAAAKPASESRSGLMFAKFSPDGSRVAYVKSQAVEDGVKSQAVEDGVKSQAVEDGVKSQAVEDGVKSNDIYVERLDTGVITRLTKDGSATTINGTSDWVYEEELNIRDGFRWSPDGRHIAYWQFDSTGVGIFSLIDDTTALYPTITKIPYPKAGTTNSAVRIGVVSADGGDTTWMQVPGDSRQNYLSRLEWLDPRTVAIQHLNRLQNQNDFLLGDAGSGAVTRVFRDTSSTWVEVVEEVRWIDKGRAFLWISERDGWQHVYRVARDGGNETLITKFDADVTDVVGTDESGGWLYFIASPSNATERYLYRSKLDGSGTPARVTPEDQRGTHTYDLAPGGRLAFHTWSQMDRPPAQDVIELPSHRSLRALTDISALQAKLGSVLKTPTEFLTVDVGEGAVLDGWMLKPSSFNAARKYPVIVFVYGEPASQTVTNRWGGGRMLFHRALAESGYVVVSFDNRGTPAPKGAKWRKVIYGTVGDLSSREQAAAIRALAARHTFIDADRIGVWGWSGGGSNTLNCMFRFADLYKVGVSVAPVPDQKLYDTIYQERYMGLPQENTDGYRLGSPISFAEGLKGRLLVVHGSGDDNVHYQGTERLVNRLVELGKPFDLMVYPNRTHAIAEGPGTTPHVYQLIARYFWQHLPPTGH